jgi:prolyl oligopeptidase
MRLRTLAPFLLVAACEPAAPPQEPPALTAKPASAPAPASPVPALAGLAPARTVDVVETLFGLRIADPYRWMEGNENPELDAWLRAQGAHTAGYLALLPGRDALFQRIRSLGLGTSGARDLQLAGGRSFYMRIAAGEQLPKLVVRDAAGERHASVNSYAPSPDGALLAFDLALGGGEISSIHLVDVATGKALPDVIDRVWGEFSAGWLPDGKGFFYTQMAAPAPGVDAMLRMAARLHVVGTPVEKDVAVLGGDLAGAMRFVPEEFPIVAVTPGSKWMVATAGGAHNESRISVAPLAKLDRTGAGKTPWRAVAEYADKVEGMLVHGDRIYLSTFKDASNRKIVSVPLRDPDLGKATVEVPESADGTIVSMGVARDAMYVQTMVGGRARLLRSPWKGAAAPVALPFDGWISELATDPLADGVTIDIQGWTRPGAFWAVDAKTGKSSPTGIAVTTTADYSAVVAEEVEATSADGTKVPLSILRRKDLALDGSHPALLYGYGGYGSSETPSFEPTRLAWIERGGVFAVCHVRGGGEKGYRWQADGSRERKMNGVHDFEACGQDLIDRRLTSPAHLSGRAGSMGGVLIGRAITERPDLFVAANVAVGIVNPVRILAAENGANQKVELGDPETEAGLKAIHEMDAYHHVVPGAAYPAVIFTVGLNDRRVAPWMTGKMAARMQIATSSGRPVLIRIDADAGHGIGSMRDQVFAERADVYSFFLAASGDPGFQPR